MIMKAKKILFVVNKYFPYGGMQRSMLRIAGECQRRGYDIVIITGQWEGRKPLNIEVQTFPLRSLTNHGRNARLEKEVKRLRATDEYTCVVGFTKIGGLDIYYAGDPCLASRCHHNKSRLVKILPRYRVLLAQENAVFNSANNTEILLIAHHQREEFMRHYQTPSELFHLLPPGIDRRRLVEKIPDQIACHSLRAKFHIASADQMLLMVGSNFRTKGIDRAIIALASLPENVRQNCRLIVIGEGKAHPYLKLARDLHVNNQISFLGARDDAVQFYYCANCLIHPARTENTGTVILEAMACGLPVLVTGNCGFAHHVMAANAGMVCLEPFDQKRFNEALMAMLQSTRLNEWQGNGRKYCELQDLYSLIDKAADIIVARAEQNFLRNN